MRLFVKRLGLFDWWNGAGCDEAGPGEGMRLKTKTHTRWVGGKNLFPELEAGDGADSRMYDPGQAWNHEIQRAVCWAVNKGKVIVACARGEQYDRERWRAVAEGQGGAACCVVL